MRTSMLLILAAAFGGVVYAQPNTMVEGVMSADVRDLTNTCADLKSRAGAAMENEDYEQSASLLKQLKQAKDQLKATKQTEADNRAAAAAAAAAASAAPGLDDKITAQKAKMKEAITNEDYDLAAKLSTELKALKKQKDEQSSAGGANAVAGWEAKKAELKAGIQAALASEDYAEAAKLKKALNEHESQQPGAGAVAMHTQIAELENKIKSAVEEENYALAAQLKKELKSLKPSGGGPPSPLVFNSGTHYRYAGCFSHASQSLIKSWDNGQKNGLTVEECRQHAIQDQAIFFVMENPSGAKMDNRATCGWSKKDPARNYDADGELPALRCDPNDEGFLIGGQSAFAAYDASSKWSPHMEGSEDVQIAVRTGDLVQLKDLMKNVELNGVKGVVHEVVDDEEDARCHIGLVNGENVSVAFKNMSVVADKTLKDSYNDAHKEFAAQ